VLIFRISGFKIKIPLKPTIICIRQRSRHANQKEEVAMMVNNYYASLQSTKTVELLKKIKKCKTTC
jgi:hypothetical protein